MMNNINDNGVSPLLSNTFFCKRFYGMEIFCPISDDSKLFQRVKIIDHSHFQAGDEILEYVDTIDEYLFENLKRFTSEDTIFNQEYYVEGERYVNYHSGCVAKLKKFTPTELTFANDYISDIHWLYKTEMIYPRQKMGFADVWLRLGENRIKDVVSDKQVISEDKLRKECAYNIPSIIIYDLEKGDITSPRKASPDRTRVQLSNNNDWIDIHDDRYKYYQLRKTKTRVQLKEISIDDLKSDCNKSFDLNAIGENKMLVVKTFNDDKYFVSVSQDAEKIYAKHEDGGYRDILADEVSAVYIVDTSDIDDLIQIAKIMLLKEQRQ